jgi:hypothetical protein
MASGSSIPVGVEMVLGSTYLRNSLSTASRGETAGDLPKNCHLPPSTAILKRQYRYARFNRSIPCRSRAAGQTGPQAENRERGQEERRWDAAIECGLCHDLRIDCKGRVHEGV